MDETAVKKESLEKHLFSNPETNVYAVLDGASVPNLPQVLWEMEPEHICLYRGKLEPDMAAAAPYLVNLLRGHPFTDWLLAEGWGKHWGFFAVTPGEADLKTMRTHFRRFLMVTGPDDKPLYFRYYDPRVLRVYLPTCNREELNFVFGPAVFFMLEDENPATLLAFSPKENGESLQTQKNKLSN